VKTPDCPIEVNEDLINIQCYFTIPLLSDLAIYEELKIERGSYLRVTPMGFKVDLKHSLAPDSSPSDLST
jgi:hypothetical protein